VREGGRARGSSATAPAVRAAVSDVAEETVVEGGNAPRGQGPGGRERGGLAGIIMHFLQLSTTISDVQ
jgi:hypothetical protein